MQTEPQIEFQSELQMRVPGLELRRAQRSGPYASDCSV